MKLQDGLATSCSTANRAVVDEIVAKLKVEGKCMYANKMTEDQAQHCAANESDIRDAPHV